MDLIASWRCLGVILFTFKSFEAFPASSRTSVQKYIQSWSLTLNLKSLTTVWCWCLWNKKCLILTGSEVLEDGRAVHGSSGPDPARGGGAGLQMTMNSEDEQNCDQRGWQWQWLLWQCHLRWDVIPANGELKSCPGTPAHSFLLCLSRVFPCFASSHFWKQITLICQCMKFVIVS